MNRLLSWPEPVVRVQHLSDSGIRFIPDRYVKKPEDRPCFIESRHINYNMIPVIDMNDLYSDDASLCRKTSALVGDACRDWGFFQVVNHGVSHQLMAEMQEAWRHFFKLPLEEKQKLANSPATYEGYGSRLGIGKEISLDWSDYFFLHYLPLGLRDQNKWPSLPISCRELIGEYCSEVVKLGGKLMKIMSANLGLTEDYLQAAFGGEDNMSACMRVNYYPKCPQPDLTLGLSPHSDPGGMTLLLPDNDVSGLQVRHADEWVTVNPVPGAFIVNMADQIQILSNAKYKSVEHRVVVNAEKERVSLALFYNPRGDIVIEPAKQLVTEENPRTYSSMTFDEYRLYIRTKGLHGKSQVESLIKS
ncbi:jasmonate-induced oxygenase 1-like [Henckelia pumila]|uniref:jasmonate-induced oxygenase 1-like n=1 Tax=Henckelia pumila TaxID=405737 RepID=UPI003C6DE864